MTISDKYRSLSPEEQKTVNHICQAIADAPDLAEAVALYTSLDDGKETAVVYVDGLTLQEKYQQQKEGWQTAG